MRDAAKRIRFDDDRPAVRPDRLRRFSPEDAFREFREQYDAEPDIRSIETGSYEGVPAIVAMVEPGFEHTRLPAGFRGYPVLINDGNRAYAAGGPLV